MPTACIDVITNVRSHVWLCLGLLLGSCQPAHAAPLDLCWSPDGRWLAYVLRIEEGNLQPDWFWTTYTSHLPLPKEPEDDKPKPARWQLWLLRADGGQEKLLWETTYPLASLSWHPNSETLALLAQPDKKHCQLLISRQGREPAVVHRIATDSPWSVWGGTAWRPNAEQLAASLGEDLLIFDTQRWEVVARKTNSILPAYSADGRLLAFANRFAGGIWDWKITKPDLRGFASLQKAQFPLRPVQWSAPQVPRVPRDHLYSGIMWKEPAAAGFADQWTFKLIDWSPDGDAEPMFGMSMSQELREDAKPQAFDWSGFDFYFDPSRQQLWLTRPRDGVVDAIRRVHVNQPNRLLAWNPLHPHALLGQFTVAPESERVAVRFGSASNSGAIAIGHWGEKFPRLPKTDAAGRLLTVGYLARLCDERFRVQRLRQQLNFPELAKLPLISRLPRPDELNPLCGWPERSSNDESLQVPIQLAKQLLEYDLPTDSDPAAQHVWSAYRLYFAYLAGEKQRTETALQQLQRAELSDQQRWQWLAVGIQVAIANQELALAQARFENLRERFAGASPESKRFHEVMQLFLDSMEILMVKEIQKRRE